MILEIWCECGLLRTKVDTMCNKPVFQLSDLHLASQILSLSQEFHKLSSNIDQTIHTLFRRLCSFMIHPEIIENAKHFRQNSRNGTNARIRHNIIQQKLIQCTFYKNNPVIRSVSLVSQRG